MSAEPSPAPVQYDELRKDIAALGFLTETKALALLADLERAQEARDAERNAAISEHVAAELLRSALAAVREDLERAQAERDEYRRRWNHHRGKADQAKLTRNRAIAGLDHWKSRADAAESALAAVKAERDGLRAASNKLDRTLSFFKSVIQSGEAWSATCQRDLDAARAALAATAGEADHTAAPAAPDAEGWCEHDGPWEPKVGDRIRMVKDGLSTRGAAGWLGTIMHHDPSAFISYQIRLDDGGTYESTAAADNENYGWTWASRDCFERWRPHRPASAADAVEPAVPPDDREAADAALAGAADRFLDAMAGSPDDEDMVALARTIATVAHAGQKDKAGRDYIEHPLRLMAQATTDAERIVAVLHDVAEDCREWPLTRLHERGFGPTVMTALDALTRRPWEPYSDYLDRAAQNPLARAVKINDLRDNLNEERLALLPANHAARLRERYAGALARLTAAGSPASSPTRAENAQVPAGSPGQAWDHDDEGASLIVSLRADSAEAALIDTRARLAKCEREHMILWQELGLAKEKLAAAKAEAAGLREALPQIADALDGWSWDLNNGAISDLADRLRALAATAATAAPDAEGEGAALKQALEIAQERGAALVAKMRAAPDAVEPTAFPKLESAGLRGAAAMAREQLGRGAAGSPTRAENARAPAGSPGQGEGTAWDDGEHVWHPASAWTYAQTVKYGRRENTRALVAEARLAALSKAAESARESLLATSEALEKLAGTEILRTTRVAADLAAALKRPVPTDGEHNG